MTRIAHLSDLHLVERGHSTRGSFARARLHFLSLGRAVDFDARVERAGRALRAALHGRPDHLCITGDLTEDGTDAQFDVLAEVLDACGVPPERTTLVPGNHDGYDDLGAFERALSGPLAAYRQTSTAGAAIVYDDVVITAVSTLIPQSFTRSAGAVAPEQLAHLEQLATDRGLRTRALVVAQHHPPMRHLAPGMQWIDGLERAGPMRSFVEQHDHVHVLHGHTHVAADRTLRSQGEAQAFCVPAVVEAAEPVRFYEASEQRVRPIVSRSTLPLTRPRGVRQGVRGRPSFA
jgi:3',5'-cyclic AMP phosphodiesterase CpdA